MIITLLRILSFILLDPIIYSLNIKKININRLETSNNFIILINKFINYPFNIIFIIIILYLLITLIACIKITLTFKGPLRQNN